MRKYFLTDCRSLELALDFPYESMLAEARALADRFVEHRSSESRGWDSLTLYGLSETQTGSWEEYGYASGQAAKQHMGWTAIADCCPVTVKYFQKTFPSNSYGRVRFMRVRSGGWIGPHTDTNTPLIDNVNLVLNNPRGCVWHWDDIDQDFDMVPGKAYGMNISYSHSIHNHSSEDRYHMIVSRHDDTEQWQSLLLAAALKAGVQGQFIESDILP